MFLYLPFAKLFVFSSGRTVVVCLWTSVCVQVRSILNFALVITPIVPSGASAFKACVGNGCGNMDPHGHQSADVLEHGLGVDTVVTFQDCVNCAAVALTTDVSFDTGIRRWYASLAPIAALCFAHVRAFADPFRWSASPLLCTCLRLSGRAL